MQKKSNKSLLIILSALLLLVLGACSNANDERKNVNEEPENTNQETKTIEEKNEEIANEGEMEGMDHSGMNHSGSSEVPEGLTEVANPTYSLGSQAIIHAKHMPGMDGAKATISRRHLIRPFIRFHIPQLLMVNLSRIING